MSDLKFDCPHCQQTLEAPEELLGQTIPCPACNGPIELPRPEPAPTPPPLPRRPLAVHQSPRPVPESPSVRETSGLAVASMVLGIAAVLLGLFVAVSPVPANPW